MNHIKFTSAAVVSALGIMWGAMGVLGPLLAVLLFANLADYATGTMSAANSGELNSSAGRLGILKKLGYWVVIAVALSVDVIIIFAAPTVGISLAAFPLVTPVVALWLDLNELLSILENLGELGVPLPEFLIRAIKALKKSIDEKTAQKEQNIIYYEDELDEEETQENKEEY